MDRKDIAELSLRDSISRIEKDVTNLTDKGKNYDSLTAQGVRNMMQMDNYVDWVNIR